MANLIGELIGLILSIIILLPVFLFLFVCFYSKPDTDNDGLSG